MQGSSYASKGIIRAVLHACCPAVVAIRGWRLWLSERTNMVGRPPVHGCWGACKLCSICFCTCCTGDPSGCLEHHCQVRQQYTYLHLNAVVQGCMLWHAFSSSCFTSGMLHKGGSVHNALAGLAGQRMLVHVPEPRVPACMFFCAVLCWRTYF